MFACALRKCAARAHVQSATRFTHELYRRAYTHSYQDTTPYSVYRKRESAKCQRFALLLLRQRRRRRLGSTQHKTVCGQIRDTYQTRPRVRARRLNTHAHSQKYRARALAIYQKFVYICIVIAQHSSGSVHSTENGSGKGITPTQKPT